MGRSMQCGWSRRSALRHRCSRRHCRRGGGRSRAPCPPQVRCLSALALGALARPEAPQSRCRCMTGRMLWAPISSSAGETQPPAHCWRGRQGHLTSQTGGSSESETRSGDSSGRLDSCLRRCPGVPRQRCGRGRFCSCRPGRPGRCWRQHRRSAAAGGALGSRSPYHSLFFLPLSNHASSVPSDPAATAADMSLSAHAVTLPAPCYIME